MTNAKKKIMHITEALGGGVLNVVSQLITSQIADDYEVTLVHSIRPDTPFPSVLDSIFTGGVHRVIVPMSTEVSVFSDTSSVLALLRIIRMTKPDIIHLHSSKAGVLGRLAAFLTGKSKSVFYTPHGYSFLRRDISNSKKRLFMLFEKVTNYFGGTTIACSKSEFDHALTCGRLDRIKLVENAVPLRAMDVAININNSQRPLIVSTAARLCYQKNPSAFLEQALMLPPSAAHFRWIGGGDLIDNLKIDGVLPDNLDVTGWISREEVISKLRDTDIFLMTSLWEGMPLSLIEAQACGLPAVVPDVEGCRDVVTHGVTGFVCKSPSEMNISLKKLISDTELRLRMGASARQNALKRFSVERMHQEMIKAYKL